MASTPELTRPARRQVAKQKVLGPQASVAAKGGAPGQTYNIYYDKWSGGTRRDPAGSDKEKAVYRCDPSKDAGRTKGSYNPNAYFCAFFAKGCCPHGEECSWLHRIPTRKDYVESGMDVFGRERFNDHRDDRGGVGSMRSDSKTLYVGRIHTGVDMEAVVEKHFKAWGEIERIKTLREKGVAFVTYVNRLCAEFAKEAMANQSLDHGEIINIRWATEDPNPKMQAINKRKAVEATRQAIEAKLPGDFHQAALPEPEEMLDSQKRLKQDTVQAIVETATEAKSTDQTPALYVGADGQYYYDYGQYGYNHETQQYDPARLGGYGASYQTQPEETMSLKDRVKASLSSTSTLSNAAPQTMPPVTDKPKPSTSALSALAAYGSESESEEDE